MLHEDEVLRLRNPNCLSSANATATSRMSGIEQCRTKRCEHFFKLQSAAVGPVRSCLKLDRCSSLEPFEPTRLVGLCLRLVTGACSNSCRPAASRGGTVFVWSERLRLIYGWFCIITSRSTNHDDTANHQQSRPNQPRAPQRFELEPERLRHETVHQVIDCHRWDRPRLRAGRVQTGSTRDRHTARASGTSQARSLIAAELQNCAAQSQLNWATRAPT